ncbi:helix-turn-helix domain-containing protein [Streptomyces alboflavus]|uniref:helix-turn-helix domain-containing protein n=1 Tax=Streptomyces alboflavus TaxID=67267 RepID=UPI0004BEAB1B|nr:helix-turn-helix domain-containing protein [Streptomyces alboflavus]
MANPNQDARAHNTGRYERSIETARRDARAAELRAQGWTYQQIGDELGIHRRSAIDCCRRAVREAVDGAAKDLIHLEVTRLEAMYDEVLDVLRRDHYVVSYGQIVRDDAGAPLLDDEMKLKAVDRALRTRESFRKLLGLDAPSRVSVEAEQLGREIGRLLDSALGPDGAGDDPDA